MRAGLSPGRRLGMVKHSHLSLSGTVPSFHKQNLSNLYIHHPILSLWNIHILYHCMLCSSGYLYSSRIISHFQPLFVILSILNFDDSLFRYSFSLIYHTSHHKFYSIIKFKFHIITRYYPYHYPILPTVVRQCISQRWTQVCSSRFIHKQ